MSTASTTTTTTTTTTPSATLSPSGGAYTASAGDTHTASLSVPSGYWSVYWYVASPSDTGLGTHVDTSTTGDSPSTSATFDYTFASDASGDYVITAYIYLWDWSIVQPSYTVSVSGSSTPSTPPSTPSTPPSTPSTPPTTPSTPPSVPSTPTSLSAAIGGTSGSIDLSWSAPADGGSAITAYEVTYCKYDNGWRNWTSWSSTGSTSTSYTVTGLEVGGFYRFRVKAVNSVGSSRASRVAQKIVQ